MIAVFKTDVTGIREAKQLIELLIKKWPICRINIDLDDCDKVLRIEGDDFCTHHVIELLKLKGYNCELLK